VIPWFTIRPLHWGFIEFDLPTCFALVGAVITLAFARRRARLNGLSPKVAVDGVFLILACAFVAGHVFDTLLYRRWALRADWRAILPWNGGSCSLGAGVGVALATAVAFRLPGRKIDWRYVDPVTLAMLLGLAVLRVGCFLGHHHAGRLTTFFLAVRYPGGARHDLGLYEAAIALALFAGILSGERRFRTWCAGRTGFATGTALLCYGLCRFVLEFLRGDDIESIGRHSDPRYWGLTLVQYGAVLVMAYGAWLLRSVQRLRCNGLTGDRSRSWLVEQAKRKPDGSGTC